MTFMIEIPTHKRKAPIPVRRYHLLRDIGTALTKYFLIGPTDSTTNNIPETKLAPKALAEV